MAVAEPTWPVRGLTVAGRRRGNLSSARALAEVCSGAGLGRRSWGRVSATWLVPIGWDWEHTVGVAVSRAT